MPTAGPNYAGTASQRTYVAGSYAAWSNPNNALGVADAAFATVAPVFSTQPSQFLVLTGFAFAIGSDQTPISILVEIDHKQDADISLIVENVWLTTDGGATGTPYRDGNLGRGIEAAYRTEGAGTSLAFFSYPNDVWGRDGSSGGASSPSAPIYDAPNGGTAAITAAQVNSNANFGVIIQSSLEQISGGASSGITHYIDAVRITVTYTNATASAVSAGYNGFTRTSVNNSPWKINFTGSASVNQFQIRTANTPSTGTQVANAAAVGGANSISVPYNAAGLVNGSNTLYLFVSGDSGATWLGGPYTFTLLRDDTAPTASTTISTTPSTVPIGAPYLVTFTPHDAASTGTSELGYQIWSGVGGTGALLISGSCTDNVPVTTAAITTDNLAAGANTRYLRTRDGANNWTETSFTVTSAASITVTITAPSVGGSVAGLPYGVVWSYSGSAQSDYRLLIYALDGTTVIYDSGYIASAVKAANIPVGTPLVQSVSYKVQVLIHTIDSPSLFGTSVQQTFAFVQAPPATITGVTVQSLGTQL